MEDQFSFELSIKNRKYKFDVEVCHRGENLLKFKVRIAGQEMQLQKKLSVKNTPWGILSSTFKFKKEDAAYTLLQVFKKIDGFIEDEKVTFDPQKRKKD
jgi:hypothetical protein